jgi:hypothetical protein
MVVLCNCGRWTRGAVRSNGGNLPEPQPVAQAAMAKGRRNSHRVECLAYSSCLSLFSRQLLTWEKFSASSVVPVPRCAGSAAPIPMQHVHPLPCQRLASTFTGDGGNDTDSDGSGAETEREWLDESDLAKLALRFPNNVSEAMAIEVRNNFLFSFFLTSNL